ncbi:hypothetical protein [Shewanella sp.]|uniref:hypothetical protein n=1 Tax=Shewanella sp. TaxID=50422 RepID=UPI004048D83F
MAEKLTPKQIAARAYYRANRDYILARCRAKYHESVGNKVPDFVSVKVAKKAVKAVETPKPTKAEPTKAEIEFGKQLDPQNRFNGVINAGDEYKDRKAINKAISDQGKVKTAARRRAEDIRLARELGLDLEDLA